MARMSFEQSAQVQCVGMAKPVPIDKIYQPTRLIRRARLGTEEEIEFEQLLGEDADAIIFAGPGWGKTTLLHWTYHSLAQGTTFAPLLFTLRRPEAIGSLLSLVDRLERGRKSGLGHSAKLVLLVDGYDEVAREKRQEVSGALMRFRGMKIGRFYLTCRSFYDIYDLTALHCRLAPFRHHDAVRYIRAFRSRTVSPWILIFF
jgi:hypothetical protein